MRVVKKVLIVFVVVAFLIADYYVLTNKKEVKEEVSKEETEEVEKKEEIEKSSLKISMLGDFLYEPLYKSAIDNGEDITNYFSKIKDRIKKADISLATIGLNYSEQNKKYLDEAVSLGLDAVSLATTHSNDLGSEARKELIDYFISKKVLPLGIYKNNEKDITTNIITKNNINVGLLSYTYNVNKALDEKEEVALFTEEGIITPSIKEKITSEVNTLKEKTDFIIVMLYWGDEYTYNINPLQEEMAKLLDDLKVDLIVGTHPHNMQKIEKLNNSLVFYSLGNAISADNEVYMSPTYDMIKSYQIGLLSDIELTKENNKVTISKVQTTPLISYYNKDLTNFMVVPLDQYNEYEQSHYLYSDGFNIEYIEKEYNKIIDSKYR